MKVGKGTYGRVTDILPRLAERAQRLGAHAIVDYDAAQRFGFLPWRMVRPVAHGTAIRWNGTPPDCTTLGGATLEAIIADDRAPGDLAQPEPGTAGRADPPASSVAR